MRDTQISKKNQLMIFKVVDQIFFKLRSLVFLVTMKILKNLLDFTMVRICTYWISKQTFEYKDTEMSFLSFSPLKEIDFSSKYS